jgi:hypothetical protein
MSEPRRPSGSGRRPARKSALPDIPLNSQDGLVIYFAWTPNAGADYPGFLLYFFMRNQRI